MRLTSKYVSVIIGVILLLSLGTATLAAGTEVGGNLRVWWKSSDSDNYFFFDQLDLTFKSAITENNGFRGEIRYFQVDKNNQTSGDIRVYNAYYYQNNIWGKDELNVGYFNAPFEYDRFISLVMSPSYAYVWTKQELGVKYGIKFNQFQLTAAVADMQNGKNDNSYVSGGTKHYYHGYDFSFRGVYTPVNGLSLGFGYTRDNIDSYADTYNQDIVYDILYAQARYGIFAEYTQKKPNTADDQTGSYIEGYYLINDKVTGYAGANIGISDFGTSSSPVYNNYFLGVKYQLAAKTALQAEYVKFDDVDDTWNVNVRLKVDF